MDQKIVDQPRQARPSVTATDGNEACVPFLSLLRWRSAADVCLVQRASRSDSFSSGADRHQAPAAQNDVPEWGKDYGSKRKSKKDKKVKIGGGSHANGNSNGHATVGKGGWASNGGFVDEGVQDDGWGGSNGNANGHSSGGAGYGDGRRAPAKQTSGRSDDVFNHEF